MDIVRFDLSAEGLDQPVKVGRSEECSLRVNHNTVSRNHALLALTADCRVEVRDLGSTYGTFINNARIQVGVVKPGDTVRFGGGNPFRLVGTVLEECPELVGMTIRFEGLTIELGGRTILKDIRAEIMADEFVGIVGPSGAGKSTLLACLTGVYPIKDGSLVYDEGKSLAADQAYLREKTGVVPQKDLIFEELTVRENLMLSAQIKMPSCGAADVDRLVTEAMLAVDMTDHANKPVAVLSGGQRKRVNVAIELLQRPRLLLLDEPTSGLDPDMEARLFDKLGGLSKRGMTVICVAHTENFKFFDKLIYLQPTEAGAVVAFCGPPDAFGKLGMATGAERRDTETGTSSLRSRVMPAALTRVRAAQGEVFIQAKVVLLRTFLCLRRDFQSIVLMAALPLAVAVMIVISQKDKSGPGHICFFMVIAAYWLGMTAGVREIVKERKLYIRDKLSGLAPFAYFSGKAAYAMIVAAAQAFLLYVAVIVVFAVTVRLTQAGGLLGVADKVHLLALLMSSIPLAFAAVGGALSGIMVSIVTTTERMAVTMLPLILLPQILLSRVAYGETGGSPLLQPPFGSVIYPPQEGYLDTGLYVASMGFATRPCSNGMALCFKSGGMGRAGEWPAIVTAEWLYMLILFLVYLLLAGSLFLRLERKWNDWR